MNTSNLTMIPVHILFHDPSVYDLDTLKSLLLVNHESKQYCDLYKHKIIEDSFKKYKNFLGGDMQIYNTVFKLPEFLKVVDIYYRLSMGDSTVNLPKNIVSVINRSESRLDWKIIGESIKILMHIQDNLIDADQPELKCQLRAAQYINIIHIYQIVEYVLFEKNILEFNVPSFINVVYNRVVELLEQSKPHNDKFTKDTKYIYYHFTRYLRIMKRKLYKLL